MITVLIQFGLLLLLVANILLDFNATSEVMRAAASINTTILVVAISYVNIISNLKMRS